MKSFFQENRTISQNRTARSVLYEQPIHALWMGTSAALLFTFSRASAPSAALAKNQLCSSGWRTQRREEGKEYNHRRDAVTHRGEEVEGATSDHNLAGPPAAQWPELLPSSGQDNVWEKGQKLSTQALQALCRSDKSTASWRVEPENTRQHSQPLPTRATFYSCP